MDTTKSDKPKRSMIAAAMCGLKVAIVGSTLVGTTEVIAIAWLSRSHFEGGWRPTDLILAGIGKAVLMHALIWCPVLAIIAAGCARSGKKRDCPTPLPLLAGLFIFLAVGSVVALSLAIVLQKPTFTVATACIVVVIVSIAFHALLRRLSRGAQAKRIERTLNILAALSVVIALVLGAMFARSPFWNPGQFRAAGKQNQSQKTQQPHVLWIVLDTVRADHLGCYGGMEETTPFLDRFAQNAIVFERTVANGIWTVPSHASMFTGEPVRAHGTDHYHRKLDAGFETVAQKLSAEGYATASFSNNAWISRATQLARGFETCRVTRYLTRLGRPVFDHLFERTGWSRYFASLDHDHGAAVTSHVVAQWLDDRSANSRPVFLFVNLMEAHLPYRAPRSHRSLMMNEGEVARSYELRWEAYGDLAPTMCFRFNMEDPSFLAQPDRDILRKQYNACIRYLDDRVEELIGLFADRGMLDNTLVVITSDHGEYLGNHDLWEHRYLTYDDVSRVALIIREPGRTQPLRVSSPVQLSDLYATVLATATNEEPASAPYGSRNLLKIADQTGPSRTAFVEFNGPVPVNFKPDPAAVRTDSHHDQPQRAAHDGQFKLMVSADGTKELYDVLADPNELQNLIDTHTDVANRLLSDLVNWEIAIPEYVPASGDNLIVDPDLKRTLQNLGYVGDDDEE